MPGEIKIFTGCRRIGNKSNRIAGSPARRGFITWGDFPAGSILDGGEHLTDGIARTRTEVEATSG